MADRLGADRVQDERSRRRVSLTLIAITGLMSGSLIAFADGPQPVGDQSPATRRPPADNRDAALNSLALAAAFEPNSPRSPQRRISSRVVEAGRAAEDVNGDPVSSLWHASLISQRTVESRLREADRAAERGDLDAACQLIQEVFSLPSDVFVRVGSSAAPVGAHLLASEYLAELGPRGWERYELLFGAEAKRQLKRALQQRDIAAIRRVARTFPASASGFEAGVWLANRALDRGANSLAAAQLRTLLSNPVHAKRVTPELQSRLAIAWHRSGHAVQAKAMFAAASKSRRQFKSADRLLSPKEFWGAATSRETNPEWYSVDVVGGAVTRNAAADATPPILSKPSWAVSLDEDPSQLLARVVRTWTRTQRDFGLPTGAAQFPVVAGDCVVFRNYRGVQAVDRKTGQLRWTFAAKSNLAADLPSQPGGANGDVQFDSTQLQRLLVANGTLGMLSTDGKRVYVVDELEANWNQQAVVSSGRHFPNASAVSRQTNRLVALAVSPSTASTSTASTSTASTSTASTSTASTSSVTPVWTVGGPAATEIAAAGSAQPSPVVKAAVAPMKSGDAPAATVSKTDAAGPLAGHFFCGAPLPVENMLFAVTEQGQQLHVVCLDAATGQPHWIQPLASPSLPISLDAQRYYLGCPLAFAEGVLVCPTHAGVIAGLDPWTGRLLWACNHDDGEQPQPASFWPHAPRRRYEHPGYPNLPVIAAGRVVYLPPHSEFIHCIDLQSGQVQWKQLRETSDQERIEYIAAATPHSLLLVGRQSCRTLALSTGYELSRHSLESMPAGRGVQTTTAYLLPLNTGRIVSIDLMDGRVAAASLVAAGSLGNLALAGDQIVSFTADTVTAFPQAAVEAARWRSRYTAVEESAALSGPVVSASERMLAAEIAVAMGRPTEAFGHLQAIAQIGDVTLSTAARSALRELKLQQLAARRHIVAIPRPSDTVQVSAGTPVLEHDTVLSELHALSSTPEERVALLMLQAETQLNHNRPQSALQTLRQVIHCDVVSLVAHPSDSGVRVTPDAWVRGFLQSMSTRYRGTSEWPSLASHVFTDIESRRGDTRLNQLHRATIQFAAWPDADDLCLEYAQAAMTAGELSAAEAVLLGLRQCGRRETEAAALRLLAEMWTDAGAYTAAGQAVHDLRNQYADVHVAPDATGREWVRNLGELHIAAQAAERLDRPTWSGRETTVSEQRWTDHRLQATYNSSGMRLLNSPAVAALDVFEAGRGPSGHLQLVNRCTGADAGQLRLPAKYFYPDCRTDSFVGHLVSVGAPGSLLGISLLNRTVAWTTSPEGLPAVNEAVRPGPAGPGFAAFQWRQHLFVVDPGAGRLLWHRSDLESQSGLMDEPTLGLFGDDNVLVVFGPDRRTFTAYDTNTGAVRHSGRLRCDARQRRLVGRNLLYVSLPDDSGSQSLCLWDPSTAEVLWSRPLDQLRDVTPLAGRPPGCKVYNSVHHCTEFAVVSNSGEVEIVCGESGRRLLSVAVDPVWLANLRDVRIFRDGQRYYINLQQLAPPGDAHVQNTFPTTDATLPLVNVQGVVLAVERSTGRLLWERSFGHRSVLHAPEYGWPVLVTLARVNANNQLALQVEVVDAATGEVVASRDGLYSNRLLQMLYDHEDASLMLKGAGTEIRLNFRGQQGPTAKSRPAETRYLSGR